MRVFVCLMNLQSREERWERFKELMAGTEENDIEEMKIDSESTVISQILETDEKVYPDDFLFLKVLGRGSFGKVMLGNNGTHTTNNNFLFFNLFFF